MTPVNSARNDHEPGTDTCFKLASWDQIERSRPPRGILAFLSTTLLSTCGILEADQFAMNTPQLLQRFYSFNTLSAELSRCLDDLIQSDEEQ